MTRLTAIYLRLRLDYDPHAGVFLWRAKPASTGEARRWNKRFSGKPAGRLDSRGHLQIHLDHRMYAAHRLAWFYVHGEWPCGEIDHKDQVKTHNWITNLRPATHSQNGGNRPPGRNNTSGVKGVSWNRRSKKWQAYIGSRHLGYFAEKQQAIAVRIAAATEHFGVFASEVA